MTLTLPFLDDLPDPFAGLTDVSGGASLGRWYQEEAYHRIFAGFDKVRSQLVVMATGLGKTRLCATVARDWAGPVLWMAHRDELVQQAREELERLTGLYVEVEQGDYRASSRAQIVVGSTQSCMQQGRLDRMGRDRFSLVVCDEAHHYLSPAYRRPLDWFQDAKVLGPTATPDRHDEKALGQLFEDVAFVFDIENGIEAGYLVPLVGQRVVLTEIELDDVAVSAGDLVAGQLDEAMLKAVEGIVRKTFEFQPDRQGIAFFPGIRSAEYAMQRFNAMRPGSAIYIDGTTDKWERRQLIQGFREGRYKYLCNCDIAGEGFDAPTADLIIHGRPTKSRNKYAQYTGRGTRVLKGVVDHIGGKDGAEARRAAIAASAKPNAVILDFVGNSTKHSLMTLEDVLGGNFTEEEVALAKKKREKGGDKPEDARENLLKARRELMMKAMRMQAKKVKAEVHPFDPFKVLGVHVADEDRYTDRFGIKPASEAQLSRLREKGVPEAELKTLSFRAATQLMDRLIERHNLGLATYKQLRQLQKYGINDTEIPFDRASAAMTYISEKGWGRNGPIDPKVLNEILRHRRESGEEG